MGIVETLPPASGEGLRSWALELLENPDRWPALMTLLPEVAALRGVPQRPDFHAEGDVLTHTALALAALPPEAEPRVVWAVLLHDVGKVATTCLDGGVWRSPGHADAGALLVPQILGRFGREELAADVAWLVRHHQFHLSWQNLPAGLSRRQRSFCVLPLFDLLLQVCKADAAASQGSAKGELLAQLRALLASPAE